MADTTDFWDRVADKYLKDPIEDMEAYNYTCARTLSYLKPEHSVLELGCGTGMTARRFAPAVSYFLATDISKNMIAIAEREAAKEVGLETLAFQVGSAEQVLDGAEQWDVIMAHSVLHLVPNPLKTIDRVASKLRPGGLFVSKTVCMNAETMGFRKPLFRLILPIMRLMGRAPKTVHFFSPSALEQDMERAGFEILECGSHPNGKPPARYIVARKI